jgi:GT2 family glycosyltransferase
MSTPRVTIAIPSFGRERVLVETLEALQTLPDPAEEIIVVDQTPTHESATEDALTAFAATGAVRWIRLSKPSIPAAMNEALREARGDLVLCLDDDILPGEALVASHREAHARGNLLLVAGQVLQPGDEPRDLPAEGEGFRFSSSRPQRVSEFPGGNFSIRRNEAISMGGFDERFVQVAYRFEREFADRFLMAGGQIFFEPSASIRHLKAPSGGTRVWGNHLTSLRPGHSVGAYYYLLTSPRVSNRIAGACQVFIGAVATRFHLRHPWWIPAVIFANAWAFAWALVLKSRGPALLPSSGTNE